MQKAAIKKMDMQATKEFLAELKVLTRVHHLNLVLIFYSLKHLLVLILSTVESHSNRIFNNSLDWI
jgi:chitin elicitor receptor kinase 1